MSHRLDCLLHPDCADSEAEYTADSVPLAVVAEAACIAGLVGVAEAVAAAQAAEAALSAAAEADKGDSAQGDFASVAQRPGRAE